MKANFWIKQDLQAGAVTTTESTQVANRSSALVKNAPYDEGGKKRVMYFSFTQGAAAGDANSLATLAVLPQGKIRLLKSDSKFVCSAFGAARTLDIGYLAHTNTAGATVAASQDAILDGADVSAAAAVTCGAGTNALGTDNTIAFDSISGVTLQAKCLGDTIPAGATLKGYFTYIQD